MICVTQGLIDNMDREELQGVIGHEMSHIADYDIRTMMMVAVLVGGIAMLSDFMTPPASSAAWTDSDRGTTASRRS